MEIKTTQQSKFFQIPIKKYEEDIEADPRKENKKEIIDIFTNSNFLRSKEEFNEIKYELHDACRKGDVDLIKFLLSETIENDSKTLTFKIDRTNQTASLFKVKEDVEELVIPRTIKYESTDYLITSIRGTSDSITSIKFVEDSAVRVIYGDAFPHNSNIREIYFPASLKELKEGWCCWISNLKKIEVSPSNNQFVFKEEKYLLGKSDENNDEFDVLLFARRDIEKISIPPNIKIISSFAFCYCENLTKIEIPQNSNLQTIERSAFSSSNIKEIYFPASLKELKEGWYSYTSKLIKIKISPLNDQFVLKEDKYLLGKSDENNEEFDVLLFARRDIEEISIPPNIKIISSCAFYGCENLAKVEIPPNSNLQTIKDFAFSSSNIREIFIPSKVSKICEDAFSGCKFLTKVEIPPNSNLQTIEGSAFCNSNIEEIYFPASLKKLKEGWCSSIYNLKKIEVSPSNNQFVFKEDKYLLGKSDENNDEFDVLLFVRRDIEEISIPPNIKIISSCAFCDCKHLTKVEIPPNSNLQTIKDFAFSSSNISEIFIPSKVSKICEYTFSDCQNLVKVKISQNSNLQTIERSAFSYSNVEEIYFPASLKELEEGWCFDTRKLKKIEVSPSNNRFVFKEERYLLGKSDENNDEFDAFLFARRDIEEISIPPNIKIISSYAFEYCEHLTKVEIPQNSNLQTIEECAFSSSNIREIFIPSKVSKICVDAFSDCKNLQIIEISEESELESITYTAFYECSEIMIMIPLSSSKKLIK